MTSATPPSVRPPLYLDTPLGGLAIWGDERGLDAVRFVSAPPAQTGPVSVGQQRAGLWLEAYFRGEQPPRWEGPLLGGTAWQQRVWLALLELPYGTTTTYGQLAARLGAPGAARAVGHAVGANPLLLLVPCHRVLGSMGRLQGYSAGLARKQWLLNWEDGQGKAGGRTLPLPFP